MADQIEGQKLRWFPADYDRIQRMIDATLEGHPLKDDTVATEEYVDDCIRGVENEMNDDRGHGNDISQLQDQITDLERRLDDGD